ncbi:prolyl-tRNA synthetase [candidate division WWE3 bacterium]|uniref:Proline--tRNA ligase n=1 Tax=candidate division WWE3 bacterium TaxID=2053526 RepID=A0A7X9E742_UNCKA|nr:prolyl-tRNA synthetase [candidate division WWE3 bacterium]
MRYSQLIGKTKKDIQKDEVGISAQYLIRGGFIHKELAGVYTLLPLGLKVVNKITQIIREEINAIDAQELSMTAIQNPDPWKKSGRWDDNVVDIWFKTLLKNGSEVGLATTHEEPLTKLLSQQVNSYKDLPLYVYQFQTKFRNEPRPRSGLLRAREFIMKDLYSFNTNKESHEEYYERAKQAYIKIWERLGIGKHTYLTFASGGTFSKYSHEFQTLCENGEDTIYVDKKKKIAVNKEVFNDEVLKELNLNKKEMEEEKAIEVGNIFPLGTKYSQALGLMFTDETGGKKPVVMGSYGIGIGRVMATIVELIHDDKGIIWPENVSPCKVHLIGLNLDDEDVNKRAEEVYSRLKGKKIDVLFDDRKEATPGEKFADADLIGITYRAVVSSKTREDIEIKRRDQEKVSLVPLEDFIGNLLK